jgi:probable HAF family extracellular repeat protein
MRVAMFTSAILLTLAIAVPTSVRAQSFQGLGMLPGGTSTFGFGVSADGLVAVGTNYPNVLNPSDLSECFRWTAATGMVGLGNPAGYDRGGCAAVSANGSVIAGGSATGCCNTQVWRWTSSTGFVLLGFLPGDQASYAMAINGDGSVIVGNSTNLVSSQAYRWTAATGMVGLGWLLPGHDQGRANGVSADGSVVVGHSGTSSSSQAFRWTAATGMVGLGFLPGYNDSVASAVSADGIVVVGVANMAGHDPSQALRWTSSTGIVGLGFLPGGSSSSATAVNADGSVIVGVSNTATASEVAFRWTSATGMQSIQALLAASGVNVTGWNLRVAYGVSSNGQVIVGQGQNPSGQTEAWIARLSGGGPGPGPGPGLITISNVLQSLASLQGTVESGHGALNANLGTLAEIGEHHGCKSVCINAYGLYSAERGPSFDDPGYLGTVGLAKALTRDVSAGVTLGIGSQRDGLANNSSDKQSTVSGGVHVAYTPDNGPQAIGGAIISRILTTIDRGYLNGNTPVTSTGDTKGTGTGGVVRLGWAARLSQSVRVIPFADYEITRVRYSAYTETTGPFPAVINAIDDTQQRTRLGMEARYWFTPLSYVWGTAAWGHRITGTTAPINGTLIGLFDVAVPGSAVTRDWTETTAGLRYALNENAVVTTSLGARLGGGNSAITTVRTGLSVRF